MVLEHDHAASQCRQRVVNHVALSATLGLVLVTGGSGFVGQSLVEALIRVGVRVRVLARGVLPVELSGNALVERTRGDILDASAVSQALSGVTTVVHAAGGRSESVASMWRANVEGTRLLAQAAKNAGVRRFVHISSAGVYGHRHDGVASRESDTPAPDSAYGYSKLEGERALSAELGGSSVAWSILRPYGIYGPRRLEFFREVLRRHVWLYGPGKIVVHPTHVDDVVRAMLHALELAERPDIVGETFNVAGERAVEHFEHVQLVAQALGKTARRLALPRWLASSVQPLVALGGPLARLDNREVSRTADTSKIQKLLGWQPLPLVTGITATIKKALEFGQL